MQACVSYTECGEEVVPVKRPIWALRVLPAYMLTLLSSISLPLTGL